MSVNLILYRPYLGPANLRIDASGRATGFMTTPEQMANVREFNCNYARF